MISTLQLSRTIKVLSLQILSCSNNSNKGKEKPSKIKELTLPEVQFLNLKRLSRSAMISIPQRISNKSSNQSKPLVEHNNRTIKPNVERSSLMILILMKKSKLKKIQDILSNSNSK